MLDGEQEHTGLLKYALTEENFADTLVMLIVSMAQPWEIADSLSKWSAVLSEHVDKLRIAPDTMKVYEESCKTFLFMTVVSHKYLTHDQCMPGTVLLFLLQGRYPTCLH